MKRSCLFWPGVLLAFLAMLTCPRRGQAATIAITSGEFQTGTITSGSVDAYTFTGSIGDNIVVRVGSTNFVPRIDLYAPGGAVVTNAFTANGNIRDAVLYYQLTSAGTFTAKVSSYFPGGGGYGLKFAQLPGLFVVPPGEAGGPMTNGATYAGQVVLGGFDIWSFSGNAGDNIQVRMGATGFVPRIDLYGPDGVVLTNGFTANGNYRDAWLALQLTNSGTFTVVVSRYFVDASGGYSLNLAQLPEAFVVSPGEQGGPLTNGVKNVGQIGLGGLQMWAFHGDAGDNIQLRMGATGFVPRIDLYAPDGALLTNAFTANGNIRDAWLPVRLTSSGTFTVVVSSYFLNASGGYSLNLAQIPGAFTVSPGDFGGVLTNGFLQAGTLDVGGLDMWSFSGIAGDNVELRMGTTAYSPQISFYGPDGALLTNAFTANGNFRDAAFDLQLTNTGTFTAVVSAGFLDNTGDYTLTLAHEPDQVFAAPGDEGGAMRNGFIYQGTNTVGDLDVFSFYGTVGDSNLFRIGTVNFDPWLRLYGPNGALVGQAFTANGNVRTFSPILSPTPATIPSFPVRIFPTGRAPTT
jgi:hypothetical protein